MEQDFIRDYLVTAAVFGMFSFSWFGWAQDKPPKSWVLPLGIASALGFIIAGIGGYLASQNWDAASTLNSDSDYRTFGIVVAVEILSMIIGSVVLRLKRLQHFIPTWISFVVAVHFLPLVFIFQDVWFYLLTVLTLGASLLPLRLSKKLNISLATLTGVFMGSVILLFAIRGLIQYVLA